MTVATRRCYDISVWIFGYFKIKNAKIKIQYFWLHLTYIQISEEFSGFDKSFWIISEVLF